jgi:hypothetical protein
LISVISSGQPGRPEQASRGSSRSWAVWSRSRTAHDSATAFTADYLARQVQQDGASPPLPGVSPWLGRLLDFDPARVLFAHDLAIWEPACS